MWRTPAGVAYPLRVLDAEVTDRDILDLTDPAAIAAFFGRLGYDVSLRHEQAPENLGLGDASAIRRVERIAVRDDFQVWLFELKRSTVQLIRQLAGAFRNRSGKHLLVLTVGYAEFDLVLVELVLPPEGTQKQVRAHPWVLSFERTKPTPVVRRVLRRVSFTEADEYAQYEKVLGAMQSVDWSRDWYHNHGLFSDHVLASHLPESDTELVRRAALLDLRTRFADARRLLGGRIEREAREQLLVPVLSRLGFQLEEGKGPDDPRRDHPDYWLVDPQTRYRIGFCLTYPWGRSLDGIDEIRDTQTSEESPVAVATHLLMEDTAVARWAIVTNGKQWRLFSQRADSVASCYFEMDLEEILAATDGMEGFQYFWTLFHQDAFLPVRETLRGEETTRSRLDRLHDESQSYAIALEKDLRARVFDQVFPCLASGFARWSAVAEPEARLDEARLREVFDGTLTLLYRVLFARYAEAYDLLPVREVRGYWEISATRLCEEIAEAAGTVQGAVVANLNARYTNDSTRLYERLLTLARAIAEGDAARNVPLYNGGLFLVSPDNGDDSLEARNGRFLARWRIGDRDLAMALDGLCRTVDARSHKLVPLDVRTLGVRQFGSIYEGLLERRLKHETMGTLALVAQDGKRHATGSYYTPENLVRFTVARALRPVMRNHLDHLARRFEAERTGRLKASELFDELFDLTVVDPAMGSGHFLVTAVDWITDQLVDFLAAHPSSGVHQELGRVRQTILDEVEAQKVTIDRMQLTDLNLLRRFILKRCIFGVDLNPMAVELAKVSVWLHCFTLGAPLSFLDHHLRRGNSLAGVTVDEVREASSVRQQSLYDRDNFGSLAKATERMREIVRMPDLTPSQAKASRASFRAAHEEIRELKRLLDLYAAHYLIATRSSERVNDHHPVVAFLSTQSAGQLARAKDPSQIVAKLDPATRKHVRAALDLAAAHSFFHWELEFPEIFYRQSAGVPRRGFDAVVGNPPWIRQEVLKTLKPLLEVVHRRVYDSVADIYVYFVGRGYDILRPGGQLALVLPNKWFRADYAVRLREMLAHPEYFRPRELLDFGHAKVFAEADTFPCVLRASRASTKAASSGVAEAKPLRFSRVVSEHPTTLDLGHWFAANRVEVVGSRLKREGWDLLADSDGALLDKIRRTGRPLKEVVGSRPYRGVLTGLNSAFIIDQDTRDRLIHEDPSSNKIIKKFLRGEDVDRWSATWNGTWMIFTRRGIDIDNYPAIKRHLTKHRTALEPKPSSWDDSQDGKWNGRKAGPYQWYEIQDNIAYHGLFASPKLVYQEIAFHCRFTIDHSGLFLNNKCFMIPSASRTLLAILNSSTAWWFLYRDLPHMKDEALSMQGSKLELFPLPEIPDDRREIIDSLMNRVLALTARQHEAVARFRALLERRELTWSDRKWDLFWRLDHEALVDKLRKEKARFLDTNDRASFLKDYDGIRAELNTVRAEICRIEVQLQRHVCDLYGLSAEEVALMRRTAPPRDPWALVEAEARECGYDLT